MNTKKTLMKKKKMIKDNLRATISLTISVQAAIKMMKKQRCLQVKSLIQSEMKIQIKKIQNPKRIFLLDLKMMKMIKRKIKKTKRKSGNLKKSFEIFIYDFKIFLYKLKN